MGADNDFDPFALKNLKEMERGLPEEGVKCIVLVDRAKGPTTEGDDRTDRVVRIKRNTEKGLKSEVLARPGEVNMADPAVLEKFLASVIKTFPAQHYALIMWDHRRPRRPRFLGWRSLDGPGLSRPAPGGEMGGIKSFPAQ